MTLVSLFLECFLTFYLKSIKIMIFVSLKTGSYKKIVYLCSVKLK